LCCETRSCHARRHNDLEGHSNFSSTIYSFSILCLEHHYCGDQQWRSLTEKLNLPSAFVYFRWSWSWTCCFGLVYITAQMRTKLMSNLYGMSVNFCLSGCLFCWFLANTLVHFYLQQMEMCMFSLLFVNWLVTISTG